MSADIEKAKFYLKTEEFDKAEEIFSTVFDSDENSIQAIKGLVICKIAQSNFDNSKIKAAGVYFDKLNELNFYAEEKEELTENILKQIHEYFKRLNKKFQEEANELTKRPALYGQLYTVKQLVDTTDYMGFLNNHVNKFEEGINLAAKTYDLTKLKEDVAQKIFSLHELLFQNIKNTPQMMGKTLLEAKGLSSLKESQKKWLDLTNPALK